MGNWRARHPHHATGWGNHHQLSRIEGANYVPGSGAASRFLLVVVPFAFIGACGNMLSGDDANADEGLQPTSVITYDADRPGYIWTPGDEQWEQVDELGWDATVPSSYPTPLPSDVLILPEE